MLSRITSIVLMVIFFQPVAFAQVQLQTGSGNYSIPIFNWTDDKSNLKSFVSLTYNSGNGLKVNEVASSTGQGWNLVSGGVITRMQVGEPDDQLAFNGNGTPEDIRRYPAGYLYAQRPAQLGYPNNLVRYPIYRNKNQQYAQRNDVAEDKQLDYFFFQFNGKSGVFVIDTLGADKGVALNDERIKISFQFNSNLNYLGNAIRTTIQSITIQDIDGLRYKFEALGVGKILKTKYCDRSFTHITEQPKFKNHRVYYQTAFHESSSVSHRPWIVNSWHLTEIEDPLTLRKITFNYTPTLIENFSGDDVTFFDSKKDYVVVNRKRIYAYMQEISSIVMPDGHRVDFTYGSDRLDYSGKPLQFIDVKYKDRFVSKYKLNTSYFILRRIGTPVTIEQRRVSRLCLLSIQQYGVDLKEEAPGYFFDYYTGSGADDDVVPPYFCFLRDNWGYYNGYNTKGYTDEINFLWFNKRISSRINIDAANLNYNQGRGVCFLRSNSQNLPVVNPKEGYAKNGLLRQVILPTGGTLKFVYSQNRGMLRNDPNHLIGGVHVSSTEVTDGGFQNNCANPLITNYRYVLEGSGGSSLWGIELPVHSMHSVSFYAPESKYYQWKPWKCGLFGCCDWRFKYPGIPSADQASNMSDFMQLFTNYIAPALSVVSFVQNVASIVTVATGGNPVSLIINLAVDLIMGVISCIGDQSRTYETTMYFNYDMNTVSPLAMQFSRVEVAENDGGNGVVIHEFTNTSDLQYLSPDNSAFSSKQRFLPWAYGLPKRIVYRAANGNLVKEVANQYEFKIWMLDAGKVNYLQNAKYLIRRTSSQRHTDWTSSSLTFSNVSTQDVSLEIYGIYKGRAELSQTIEKTYQDGGSTISLTTQTTFQYNSKNNELSRSVEQKSNGDIISTFYRYSCDFVGQGSVFTTLNEANIISLPVESEVSLSRVGDMTKWLTARRTNYIQIASGAIVPAESLERRYRLPSTNNPPPNFKITETFTYGANGKLLGMVDEGGRRVKKMYDYDDKYVVAEVINVNPGTRTLYTSFENSNNTGEWTITGTTSYTNATNVTGNRVFTLIPGQNSVRGTNLFENSTNPYRLSFWASAANFSFTTGGATLITSGPVKNGYTYYEYQLTPSTTTIAISASGTTSVNIDELRCYPINARMVTTTYDALIGKTSECDANNRITYFDYDNLGRKLFVRDADKNIVRSFEYNSVSRSKLNGCPGAYTNNMISEEFRKTNCGPGFMGGLIEIVIPAGRYTSSISQADADAKAEQYLLDSGQIIANASTAPGSCLQIYYNAAVSRTDTSENCPDGYIPGPVTYTVPAGKYSSTISQADADEQAQDDIDANFDHFADSNPNCLYSTLPFWEIVEPEQTQCIMVNGVPHLFYLARDVNPHSPTFNQTTWRDSGPGNCTPPPTVYARLYVENVSSSSYGAYGDVVVRFFADQACTIPVTVNNLSVNYNITYSYQDCFNNSYQETSFSFTVNNANSYYLGFVQLASTDGLCIFENWNYSLLPGTGYTVQ